MRTMIAVALGLPALLACSGGAPDDASSPAPDTTAAEVQGESESADFGDEPGFFARVSANPFDETVARAESAISDAGFSIVTRFDHGDAARRAGLDLEPSVVLVFGDPDAGTPLIAAAPTIALDLPLKLLIWQRSNEFDEPIVRVGFNQPEYLAWRHDLPADDDRLIALRDALSGIVNRAVSPR